MAAVRIANNLIHTFIPMILKKNSCFLGYESCLWVLFYVKWSALSSWNKASLSSTTGVFIKDWDEKSLSIRKEMPHRSLLCCRCLNTWSKMALQPCSTAFVFAIIVDWFFSLCAVWSCLSDFHLQSPLLKEFMGCRTYAVCYVIYILSHRIKLNCCHTGTALYPPSFSSHKRYTISDFSVVLFQEPDLIPLPVTGSWLTIFEGCKYSIISTFG